MRSAWTRRATAAAIVAAAAGLLLVGPAASPASAHVPFLEPDRPSDAPAVQRDPFPGAIRVPDASISRAVYGTLAAGEAFDAYRLTVSQPSSTPVEMLSIFLCVPGSGASSHFIFLRLTTPVFLLARMRTKWLEPPFLDIVSTHIIASLALRRQALISVND